MYTVDENIDPKMAMTTMRLLRLSRILTAEITVGSTPNHCRWETPEGRWGYAYYDKPRLSEFINDKMGHAVIYRVPANKRKDFPYEGFISQ